MIDAELSEQTDLSEPLAQRSRVSAAQRAAAWMVHLFTASGVVFCLLALDATFTSDWRMALIWLVVAVAIDACDGTLARLVRVKEAVPDFDGTLLDNLIDFISYVLVPALIIHRAELLPPATSFVAACAICVVSTFQFCQDEAKTPDNFFKGFPSYWNITALYLLAMRLSPAVNLVIVTALVLLVFVPVKYIYVNRTKPFRRITIPLTVVWAIMALGILWQLPDSSPLLVWTSLLYVLYYAGMSLYLTLELHRQR